MYAAVVFPLPIDKEFDYLIPEELQNNIRPGQRVVVPWHGRRTIGYITQIKTKSDYRSCQPIIRIVDFPPRLDEESFALARWLKEKYFCSFGKALATILPPETKFISSPDCGPVPGQITSEKLDLVPGEFYWWPDFPVHAEKEIYPRLINSLSDFSRRSILFLVPDIPRAKQLSEHLMGLTNLKVCLWHSALPAREKNRRNSGWRPIIVATRGGLFLPGISPDKIIVEDEFSIGQHQETEPFYYLRDVAAFVARQKKAALIFVEKVPSAAISEAVLEGRIKTLNVSEQIPVTVSVLAKAPAQKKIFSPALQQKILENLLQKKRVILVHSQAGYSRQLECRRCQMVFTCKNCSVALSYHKQKNILFCPYCGQSRPVPETCPRCGGKYFQPRGIGRERLIDYLKYDFEGYRIARDSDLEAESAEIIVAGIKPDNRMTARPDIGLVVFLNLDVFISRPDFTAAEEAYRIVNNFRQYFSSPGEIIIFTRYSDHYIFNALKNFPAEKFWSEELALRREFAYPPARTMLIFNLRSPSRTTGEKIARDCSQGLSRIISSEDILLGPVETTPERYQKKFHWQIILKILPQREKEIFPLIRRWLSEINLPANVYLKIAVEGKFYNEVI